MGEVISLEEAREQRDADRPGWAVASRVMCLECGNEWVGVIHPEAKPVKLQCRKCEEFAGIVMEWDSGGV